VGAGKEGRGGFGRRSRSLRERVGDGGKRWDRQEGPGCSEGRGAMRGRVSGPCAGLVTPSREGGAGGSRPGRLGCWRWAASGKRKQAGLGCFWDWVGLPLGFGLAGLGLVF